MNVLLDIHIEHLKTNFLFTKEIETGCLININNLNYLIFVKILLIWK